MAASGETLKTVRLSAPVSADAVAGLALGDVVYLDGVIYTGREKVYKAMIEDGWRPPVDLATLSNVNFHCSPAASVEDDGSYRVRAVTATASFRFAKWLEEWFRISGCRAILGKGGMSAEDYRRYFVPNGAVYLTTVGYGTGALLGRGIKRVREVHGLAELGIAQALWVLEVENFGPFLVEGDPAGNSLFERHNAALKEKLGTLYEGLGEPSLGRFGETGDRGDELI